MSTYSEIQALLEAALSKDAAVPMGVQMKLLKFSKAAVDPVVAEEAVQAGGVALMIKMIKRADQNQTTAMKTLVALLSRPEGLQALETEKVKMIGILYENLYSTVPAVVALSLGLINILVNYYDDSYSMVSHVAKESSVMHSDVQYAPLVEKLTRGILTEVQPALLVLCGLVEKSVVAATTDIILSQLRAADIMNALNKGAEQIPAQREDLQNDVKRLANLVGAEGDVLKNLEKTHWQSDRLAESMFKVSSPGLVSKVTALTSLAEMAGIVSNEGMMMKALTQHLQQMEEKMNAMNKDQQQEMNKAIEKQQAAMDAQLADQKALYEQKLFDLQNDSKLEAADKTSAALALQIEELKSNQATLMAEYNKNQGEITEQNYLRQHKQLWLFYQVIQMKLNELFLGYKVLSSGLVAQNDGGSKTEKGIQTAIMIAGDLIPFPGASTVAGVITGTMKFVRSRKTEKKAEHASTTAVSGQGRAWCRSVFACVCVCFLRTDAASCLSCRLLLVPLLCVHLFISSFCMCKTVIHSLLILFFEGGTKDSVNVCCIVRVVGNMEQISESCARILALRYESQLRALEENGARLLGECAVRRMMEAMRVGCLDVLDNTVDNKAVAKQLVDTIIQVEKKQGILNLKHKPIPTLPGTSLSWHEQAIFKKPGIRTIDGEFFHSPPETDVTSYGYRMGTAEEAKELHYMKCRIRQHSSLDLSVGTHLSFYFSPSGSTSHISFSCPPSPMGSTSLASPSASTTLPSPLVSSSSFITPTKSANTLPPPYKSPSPESPLLQITSETGSSTEVQELKKTVADLQKRLEQMEAMMLLMSAKLFPK